MSYVRNLSPPRAVDVRRDVGRLARLVHHVNDDAADAVHDRSDADDDGRLPPQNAAARDKARQVQFTGYFDELEQRRRRFLHPFSSAA